MKILVLGGTVFVGWHIANLALERGHDLTLFNRGQSNPAAFLGARRLRGDREAGDLEALKGGQWDVVIDTCGYDPQVVKQSAQALSGQVGLYTFVSSLGVYKDRAASDQDESASLIEPDDEVKAAAQSTRPKPLSHGPKKVLCELEIKEAMAGRALIIRPGLMIGPQDHTDRFTYWPVRVARGGEILAPGPPDSKVQILDARDFAKFVLDQSEAGTTDVFNVAGPAEPLTMRQILEACLAETNSGASFTWVSEEFLKQNSLRMYLDLPLWVASELAGINQFNIGKALAAGLTHRPLAHTIRDTLAWHETRPAGYELKAGLSAQREAQLLEKWHGHALNS